MSDSYERFLRRMIQYRDQMKMSQQEVGGLFGKTQSQLSKMELGKILFSYQILESLLNDGWDIDYMITGKVQAPTGRELTDYLEQSIGGAWEDIKEVLLWIIGVEFRKDGGLPDEESRREYDLLKLLSNREVYVSVLVAVRDLSGFTQIEMAEKLGVDIKTYRDFEKNKNYPDAELLIKIYEISFCRPSIFFYHDDMERYLLNGLWNRLSEDRKKEALEYLDYSIKVYK
ncbi:MAG: helix-turn-helix domain-containing protein [Lachnospiraceae bacterium]|nr:helix-turn-helix domain-containing protein [Lachnospiraceae bacterium]